MPTLRIFLPIYTSACISFTLSHQTERCAALLDQTNPAPSGRRPLNESHLLILEARPRLVLQLLQLLLQTSALVLHQSSGFCKLGLVRRHPLGLGLQLRGTRLQRLEEQ